MRVLNGRFEAEHLFRAVRQAQSRVLLLDFDGTLAPFSIERNDVRAYAGVTPILEELSRAPRHRLVFVTGRPAGDLVRLLGVASGATIWGSHGMEELGPSGERREAPIPSDARRVLDDEARDLTASLGEARVEVKPFGVAVHVRGTAPERAAEILRAIDDRWRDRAGTPGLELHRFDGGIELRAAARSKADAVRSALDGAEEPCAAAYLGDDLTDEDAFAAMRGRGASVLVRDELRETAADLWIRPPRELVEFLESWRDAAVGRRVWA